MSLRTCCLSYETKISVESYQFYEGDRMKKLDDFTNETQFLMPINDQNYKKY